MSCPPGSTGGISPPRPPPRKGGRSAEQARQAAAAAKARADYMATLRGRAAEIWEKVEALAATRQSKHCDEAARLVADLRDLSTLEGAQPKFKERLALFRREQAAKKSLIGKLDQF